MYSNVKYQKTNVIQWQCNGLCGFGAKDQFPVRRAGMFCFSLMLPFGYEVELLAWQYAHQAGCAVADGSGPTVRDLLPLADMVAMFRMFHGPTHDISVSFCAEHSICGYCRAYTSW